MASRSLRSSLVASSSILPSSLSLSPAPFRIALPPRTSSPGLKIRAQLQNEGTSSDGNVRSSEAVRGGKSRREMLGLGTILATGLGIAAMDPESNAARGECAELTVTPSGLAFCDTALGSGIPASKGLLIKAHYSGKLENGKVFDSSYSRGRPLVFRVGVGEVIKGWDQGILGADGIPSMLAGGKRTLKIPPQLGYGERGAGCRGGSCLIPPNSTLIFDVEFVGKA